MMYGERRFMHFEVGILIVLYIFGFGTAGLGEWRLNHIHSINAAEVINASISDSAEIDYSTNTKLLTQTCPLACETIGTARELFRCAFSSERL